MKAALSIAGLLLCLVAPLLAQRGGPSGPANPFTGNAQVVLEGEALYNQKCTSCHGSGGGDGEIGPAIVSGGVGILEVQRDQARALR